MADSISAVQIYYTANVITPDEPCAAHEESDYIADWECTCTNVYGEYTEHGHGATMESGWVDPDWSISDVYEDRNDVRPDSPADDPWLIANLIVGEVLKEHGEPADSDLWLDYQTLEQWVEETIGERIGEADDWNSHPSYYAADPIQDYRTGEEVMLAAHVYDWA